MIVTPWRFPFPPADDELLTSYLARNAHRQGRTAYQFTRLYWPKRQMWNIDLDRNPDDAVTTQVALLAGIPVERVRAMIMAEISSVFPSVSKTMKVWPWLLAAGCCAQTRRYFGLQYCPMCLAQDSQPYFRRRWRLAFVAVCDQHETALLDACPHCDSPVLPHRTAPRKILYCAHCGGLLIRSGRFEFGDAASQLRVRKFQDRLLFNMDNGKGNIGDRTIGSTEYFSLLRKLASLIVFPYVERRLRKHFLLPARQEGVREKHRQLELSRRLYRANILEILSCWLSEWPESFLSGCHAAGLTRRSFYHGMEFPPVIDAELELLPIGGIRNRKNGPTVLQRKLRHIKAASTAPAEYRLARARVLYSAAIRGMDT